VNAVVVAAVAIAGVLGVCQKQPQECQSFSRRRLEVPADTTADGY
jgi:hypothetical protein